jgi:hypothetical protein
MTRRQGTARHLPGGARELNQKEVDAVGNEDRKINLLVYGGFKKRG